MTHKRKRSTATFSPNTSSTTSERDPSQSPSPYPQPHHQSENDMDTQMSNTSYPLHQIDNWSMTINPLEDPHLHSRTRKRFRDSRPDENTIHESTYAKLFSAAQFPSSPIPSLPHPSQPRHTLPQSSLHNYWALPHRRTTQLTAPPSSYDTQQTNCEDCEAPLLGGGDAMMMDCEMGGMALEEGELMCRNCKRWVCEMCAVVDVGQGRECLQCRTSRKRWVGGIGWMSPGAA